MANSGYKHKDFTKGSMTMNIIRQAIPLIVAQFAQILYSTVDRIYIGHIPEYGSAALTGLGITFPIVSLVSAFTMLWGLGGTPRFSIERGKGNNEKAMKILGNSLSLLICTSLILTVVLYLFMEPIMVAFGASNVTLPYAVKYLRIYLIGTPFLMIGSGMNYYISSLGHPGVAMVTTMSGAFINLVLDPILIFVFDMGIEGAAIATIVSQLFSFVWVISYFYNPTHNARPSVSDMKLSLSTIWSIFSMGITNFMVEATNCAMQIVYNVSLKHYGGDDYITVMTVVNSIRAIMGLMVNGLMSGAQPVLGFNYGAKRYDRVCKGIRVNTLLGVSYSAITWLAVALFPGAFMRLFTPDVEIIELGTKYLKIFFMAYIFMSLQFVGQSTFMSLGKTIYSLCFTTLRKVIIVIPMTILLPMTSVFANDRIAGIFWAEPISNIIGGTACIVTMYFTVYRKLSKLASTINEADTSVTKNS